MALFLVRHEHTEETCPTPNMGPMLLQHISEANASQMGINIHGKMAGGHTFAASWKQRTGKRWKSLCPPLLRLAG